MAENYSNGWTVGKREIALYEQFLFFPQCFQKTRKNQGLFGKGLINQIHLWWDGKHCGYQHFLLFPLLLDLRIAL